MYKNARESFDWAGYQMPPAAFHNVSSWQMQVLVTAHTRGTALSGGASTHIDVLRLEGSGTLDTRKHEAYDKEERKRSP